MDIREVQRMVAECSQNHGWWEGERSIPTLLCLIHSEVSEALEVYRGTHDGTLGEELADIVIRVMDMCEACGINLEDEVITKHQFNLTRSYRHGNKVC